MSTEIGNNTISSNNATRKSARGIQFCYQNGGSLQFASAWLGNMEHESGLNPARIQSDLTFNSAWAFNPSTNGYALGLAMMDGERRVNLLNFAKEQKKDWQAVPVQLSICGIMTAQTVPC